MFLERLGPNLDDVGMSVPHLLETVATTLSSAPLSRVIDSAMTER
jgi:hypothetical protein